MTSYSPIVGPNRSNPLYGQVRPASQAQRRTRHAVHSGAIQTEAVQALIRTMGAAGASRASAFTWKTVPQGAATSV